MIEVLDPRLANLNPWAKHGRQPVVVNTVLLGHDPSSPHWLYTVLTAFTLNSRVEWL